MVARAKGLVVTGTLGVLDLAAERGLINFAQAVSRLRRTTFRIPEALLQPLPTLNPTATIFGGAFPNEVLFLC